MTNGAHYEKYVRFPKGDPENPLTWQELTAKFQSLAVRVFQTARCDQIVDCVREMNSSTALRDIWNLTARSASLSLPAS
jgi:2-methylcitrate dehydratase PrpD